MEQLFISTQVKFIFLIRLYLPLCLVGFGFTANTLSSEPKKGKNISFLAGVEPTFSG